MKLPRTYALAEIAGFVNARYEGDSKHQVTGINEIHMVEPGDLTFVDHPKYYTKALNSKATTIVINKDVECPEGKGLIFSDDPFRDYVALVKHFRTFEPCSTAVSSTAEIGEGSVIQPNAFIGNHVKIGRNCIIHANVSIYDHSVIGDNAIIHSGTVLGGDGFYFKRRPESYDKLESCGRVVIENDVEIGANCTIDRGVSGDTVIGEGSKLDNQIHIGHDTTIGKRCLFAAKVVVGGCSKIEDDVILWGQVAVQKDLTIGKGAVVLAVSAVHKSLAPGKTYFGIPAREARQKMKEFACIRRLPEIMDKLDKF